jgi:hypothetical protein
VAVQQRGSPGKPSLGAGNGKLLAAEDIAELPREAP